MASPGTGEGAVFILFLNVDGTVKDEQRIDETTGGFDDSLSPGDGFGLGLSVIGDLDQNGTIELALGAPGDDDGDPETGAVWILYLLPDGTVHHQQKISDTTGNFGIGLSPADGFGSSTAGLGDLDGDGIPDIAVGAGEDDDSGSGTGAVWILFLNENGTVKSTTKITGFASDNFDRFGVSLGLPGDLNGDGLPELAVGATGDDDGGFNNGAVYLFSLDSAGGATLTQKISETSGGFSANLTSDSFGSSVAGIANFDGLGGGGLLIGAHQDDDGGVSGATNRGAVYLLEIEGSSLICGNAVLDPIEECDDGNTANFDGCTATCEVEDSLAVFGIPETAGVLTVEIDGEMVNIGVSSGDPPSTLASLVATLINVTPALASLGTTAQPQDGIVYSNGTFASGLFSGLGVSILINPGQVLGFQKISNTQGGFTGDLDNFDHLGVSVASLGDLDGDGIRDLATGARFDDDGGNGRGAVYILSLESAAPPVCGDLQIRLPETCDDGNTTSGDGCYQTCQIEDETELNGVAQGGTIVAQVNGTIILIATTAGQDAATVASNLAGAINLTPALQMQGISSVALTNRIVSDATFDNVTSNDPGIVVPEPGLLIMLAAGILGLTSLSNRQRTQRRAA